MKFLPNERTIKQAYLAATQADDLNCLDLIYSYYGTHGLLFAKECMSKGTEKLKLWWETHLQAEKSNNQHSQSSITTKRFVNYIERLIKGSDHDRIDMLEDFSLRHFSRPLYASSMPVIYLLAQAGQVNIVTIFIASSVTAYSQHDALTMLDTENKNILHWIFKRENDEESILSLFNALFEHYDSNVIRMLFLQEDNTSSLPISASHTLPHPLMALMVQCVAKKAHLANLPSEIYQMQQMINQRRCKQMREIAHSGERSGKSTSSIHVESCVENIAESIFRGVLQNIERWSRERGQDNESKKLRGKLLKIVKEMQHEFEYELQHAEILKRIDFSLYDELREKFSKIIAATLTNLHPYSIMPDSALRSRNEIIQLVAVFIDVLSVEFTCRLDAILEYDLPYTPNDRVMHAVMQHHLHYAEKNISIISPRNQTPEMSVFYQRLSRFVLSDTQNHTDGNQYCALMLTTLSQIESSLKQCMPGLQKYTYQLFIMLFRAKLIHGNASTISLRAIKTLNSVKSELQLNEPDLQMKRKIEEIATHLKSEISKNTYLYLPSKYSIYLYLKSIANEYNGAVTVDISKLYHATSANLSTILFQHIEQSLSLESQKPLLVVFDIGDKIVYVGVDTIKSQIILFGEAALLRSFMEEDHTFNFVTPAKVSAQHDLNAATQFRQWLTQLSLCNGRFTAETTFIHPIVNSVISLIFAENASDLKTYLLDCVYYFSPNIARAVVLPHSLVGNQYGILPADIASADHSLVQPPGIQHAPPDRVHASSVFDPLSRPLPMLRPPSYAEVQQGNHVVDNVATQPSRQQDPVGRRTYGFIPGQSRPQPRSFIAFFPPPPVPPQQSQQPGDRRAEPAGASGDVPSHLAQSAIFQRQFQRNA